MAATGWSESFADRGLTDGIYQQRPIGFRRRHLWLLQIREWPFDSWIRRAAPENDRSGADCLGGADRLLSFVTTAWLAAEQRVQSVNKCAAAAIEYARLHQLELS